MSYDLKKLQEVELSILNDFVSFCNANSLRYYLIGGALLGAVRYGGFIPWDDDIDVAMPREDYDKLQKLWQINPIKGYYLQSVLNDRFFAGNILKIRKDGTMAMEYPTRYLKSHHGIYLDIFPYDYVNKSQGLRMSTRGNLIKRLRSLSTIKAGYENGRYSIVKRMIKTIIVIKKSYIDYLIEKLCTKENDRGRNFIVFWVHNYHWRKQIHKLSTFGEGSIVKFEDDNYNAPNDTNAFLTKVFGYNYMVEPPVARRKPPHNYIKVHFD